MKIKLLIICDDMSRYASELPHIGHPAQRRVQPHEVEVEIPDLPGEGWQVASVEIIGECAAEDRAEYEEVNRDCPSCSCGGRMILTPYFAFREPTVFCANCGHEEPATAQDIDYAYGGKGK